MTKAHQVASPQELYPSAIQAQGLLGARVLTRIPPSSVNAAARAFMATNAALTQTKARADFMPRMIAGGRG